ncbi:MAG: aminoacyl-histidine dipeptidase [Acutalibacteraceae bacterium]|nr:aminoacyl-histidine dipeptidase [Acutalibacteraceae bacterium]
MLKISEFEPKKVFYYFEEISKIPRGSGNTAKIAEYCLDFAQKRGLKAIKDNSGNVVIYANGTNGYENSEPLILQGHFDMVCEKVAESNIDMQNQGITLCTDGESVWADGTTLGADDGIAIAYILALLDSDDIPHPPIEALLTNDEEIGMLGARELDISLLKGRRLINIDSEEEGIITVSCAGGVRAYCDLPLNFVQASTDMIAFKLKISGLLGGHSGIDINKHRKNANILLGRLLQHIFRTSEIYVSDIDGGKKTNVIPQQSECVICAKDISEAEIEKSVKGFNNIIKREIGHLEPDVKITLKRCDVPEYHTDNDSTRKLIFTLLQVPNGVQSMSPDIPEMVQTSLNLGELSVVNNSLKMAFFIRSNASTGKQLTVQKLLSFITYLYGSVEFRADYPAWEYRPQSPLRDIMTKAYQEYYSDMPQIQSIHAGLECGILASKMNDLDIVSFGPDISNVHTPKEIMNIESVQRTWYYLLKVLEMCK